jgi:hypothetical protein
MGGSQRKPDRVIEFQSEDWNGGTPAYRAAYLHGQPLATYVAPGLDTLLKCFEYPSSGST